MAEDVDKVDDTGTDDEQSELEEELKEEEQEKEDRKDTKKISGDTSPLGLILNIRMLRRVFQILALIGVNGYILFAWFRMPNVQALWLSIWQNPTRKWHK